MMVEDLVEKFEEILINELDFHVDPLEVYELAVKLAAAVKQVLLDELDY